jgi:amino acid adenylation domain-containing protein
MSATDTYTGLEIAVIGMSGRFPQANSIQELWANLKEGKEMITFFSDEELLAQGISEELVKSRHYIKAKGVLQDVEYFDAPFFGYTNKEADYMDPQFRVFHECVYHALEDAGYADAKYRGVTGLFAGAGFNPFWIANFLPAFKNFSEIFEISSLNAREYLTTRVAYKMDLTGPTMTLQTACSTSLVAVHMACQSLLSGEADMALAGGVSILFPSLDLPRKYGMPYQEGNIISRDGHCRPFDKDANGFMGGDGVGVVVLKRLEDALAHGDNIYAVIKGSAMNNDGAKAGYSAPSTKGQTRVIETALQLAGVPPETINYIETHGSGTKLGDPIEVQALINAYKGAPGNHCGLGSIKSNFGHLDAAAGIAGFIKTVLTLKHAQIPPSINFNEPNPNIDFENSPFYVNTLLQDWARNGSPRRAAVSSFGIGGTNAHVILEEAPAVPVEKAAGNEQLIVLSARSKNALMNACQGLRDYLGLNPGVNLQDLAYTLQVGRRNFEFRTAILCTKVEALVRQLAPEERSKKIVGHKANESSSMVFLFSGLGGQYVNMGFDLYQHVAVFREYMDEGFGIVRTLSGLDLKSILYPATAVSNESSMDRFDIAQLSVFLVETALAKALMRWGIVPAAVMGYSFGEYSAAHIAGVISLRDAIRLVLKRGELILQCEKGGMVSVPVTRAALGVLPPGVALAIDNGETCVLSGPVDAIEAISKSMQERRQLCMRLASDVAIHSPMMQSVFPALEETLLEIPLSRPAIPMVSNVTGTWVEERITTPGYWLDHLSKPVEFANGIKTLLTLPNTTLLEVGPGADISSTCQKFIEKDPQHVTFNTLRPVAAATSDTKYLMTRLQRLWQRGIDIQWEQFYKGEKRRRISLPGYAFEKHRYWFKDLERAENKIPVAAPVALPPFDTLIKNADRSQWYYRPSWKQCLNVHLAGEFNAISRWLVVSDDTAFSKSLIDELMRRNQEVVVLKKGLSFKHAGPGEYTINPSIEGQYQYLLDDLLEEGFVPTKVLHLWSLEPVDLEKARDKDIERAIEGGFYSLTNLARVMHENDLEEKPLQIFIVTQNMYSVVGTESPVSLHATILGACRVLPIEFTRITCRQIDIQFGDHYMADQLLHELMIDRSEQVIALRNGNSWTQTFDAFYPPNHSLKFSDVVGAGKVYVIVGGLCSRSNLGFVLAKHLSDTAAVKIVLLSRTEYPTREGWGDVGTRDGRQELKDKLAQIATIEAGHGRVYTVSADITKLDQLERALEKIDLEIGKINGVINVAGVMDGQSMGLIIGTNSQRYFKSQFDIKVKGNINLYKCLQERSLDFCLLSSSLTSVMGPFAAYCAANNFMDAFVHQLHERGDRTWLSINWDHLLGFADTQEDQPLAINHAEITEVFEKVLPLVGRVPQVVISSADITNRIAKTRNSRPAQQAASMLGGRKPTAQWFYEHAWQPIAVDDTGDVTPHPVIVFATDSTFNRALLKELERRAFPIVTVQQGEKFERNGSGFTIDPTDAQHYDKLFRIVKDEGFQATAIYHLWNSADHTNAVSAATLSESQGTGFYSLLNIAKAMPLRVEPVALHVVTNNMQPVTGDERLCPEKASLLGAIKVLPVEDAMLRCASFDVDCVEVAGYSEVELSQRAAQLVKLALQDTADVRVIACRKDQWLAQRVSPVTLHRADDSATTFREGGTYVFTGGLGGMALTIMEYVAKHYRANFIIVDQKSLPPRKDWKRVVDALGADADKIRQLQHIERHGSQFTLIEGDISRLDTVQDEVANAIASYGGVQGAFHIAGGIDHAGMVQTRSFDATEKILAPKLQGALVLDRLLQGETLDFVVYFSSTGNVFPRLKFGQVAYNAGHEFLDVYAQFKRRQGENAYVIHWNDWHGVGISGEAAKAHAYSIKNSDVSFDTLLSIAPHEGIYSLLAILQGRHPQVIVSAYDVQELQHFILTLNFSDIVEESPAQETGAGRRTRDELSAEYVKPSTALQQRLAGVFEEIFRVERVGIDDDFFELGGDSIKAISAISIMQRKHDLDMPVTTFFEKRTIRNMAAYLGEDGATADAAVEGFIDVAVVEDGDFYQPFPLSPIQMAYLLGRSDQFDMGGISTNVYQESEIRVDLEVLNLSFNKILNRHAMLKIFFRADGQQQFHRVDRYEIKNTDLRGYAADAQQEFIQKERKRLNNYLFDASQWPLFEISTCTLADGKHYLFFCFDHLICDAASLMILVKEWGKLIRNLQVELPALGYTYRDYILDFQQQRASKKFESSRNYWLDRLDSFPSAPAIPTKVDPTEIKKPRFNRQRKVFSKSEWSALTLRAKENNCTPSVVLCAAYARVLSYWSNSNDLAINLTLFNRYPFHEDVQKIVGDFTLLVLLGVNLDATDDFRKDIKHVQRTLLEALDNRFYDGIDFIRDLRKSRQLGTSAVMPFVFTSALFDGDLIANEEDEVLGIWGQQRDAGMAVSQTSQVYIDCTSAELNEGLELVWDYVEDLFDREIIESMFSQFVSIISNFIRQDSIIAFQLPESHVQLIDQVNATEWDFPWDVTIVDLFESQAAQSPGNIALRYNGQEMTFDTLNRRANQLARSLVAQGVTTGVPVALLAERSFDMMVGIFAILKAGGVYLPIAPTVPGERMEYMVRHAGAQVMLIQGGLLEKLPRALTLSIIALDDQDSYDVNDNNLDVVVDPAQLVYILYTSGSTGRPKGVMIEHRALVNRLNWMQRSYLLHASDRLLQKTPISFDVSVWELFWWVWAGASLTLLPTDDEKSPERLVESIADSRISTIHFVPSMFDLFLHYVEENRAAGKVASLKRIFCSGEELLPIHVQKFNRLLGKGRCQLINLYGPTEATIDVSYFNCVGGQVPKVVPIGKPIDNIKLYILDKALQKVPVGVPGQLYISGVGVARGYVNSEALTREKFVQDPFVAGHTMYATGDRAKQLADGEIVYLGRFDTQVKLRGNRIELGEIENSLAKINGVRGAVVAVKADKHNHQYLCAYLVAQEEIDTRSIRQHLSQWLPEYMIPAHYHFMDSIPLTSNGKVDRKALPDPERRVEEGVDYAAPQTALEEQLVEIYSDVLNVQKPGVRDSFFDLGGDSFRATFLLTVIQKSIGVKVSLGQIFKTPDIAGLAVSIEAIRVSLGGNSYEPIPTVEARGYYLLSAAQKRLLTQGGQSKDSVTFNIFMNQRLTGALDRKAFGEAFKAILVRHEIVRTIFELREGEAYQKVLDVDLLDFDLAYEDLRSVPSQDALVEKKTHEVAYHAFDLFTGPLFKLKLLQVADDDYIILFTVHHIVFDLWSQQVFIRDLFQYYRAFISNTLPTLPVLTIQFKDYAHWENQRFVRGEMINHQQYWLEKLSGELPVLQLPTDRPRPARQTFVGEEVYFDIPLALNRKIKEFSATHDATLFMVLLASLKTLLFKYTGQQDIIVGTPIAGREHPDLQNQLGCYINTIPLRDTVDIKSGFNRIARQVRDNALEGYEHQACPFDWIIESLELPPDPSRSALFDVSLVVSQNFDFDAFQQDDKHAIAVTPIKKNMKISKTDLLFQFVFDEENIAGTIQYNVDLFDHSRIARMAQHFLALTAVLLDNPTVPIVEIRYLAEEESKVEKESATLFSSSVDADF